MNPLMLTPNQFCEHFYPMFQKQFRVPSTHSPWHLTNKPRGGRYHLEHNGADVFLAEEHGSKKLYRLTVSFGGANITARTKYSEGRIAAHWLVPPSDTDLVKLRLII
jgi:hypothetical protein